MLFLGCPSKIATGLKCRTVPTFRIIFVGKATDFHLRRAQILLPMNFYWTIDMFFSAQTGGKSLGPAGRATAPVAG